MSHLQDIANGYANFIDQWKYDCHITLTWPRKISITKANFQARNFINTIQKKYRMKLSGTILIKQDFNSIHAHVLLFSDKKYPMNLHTVPSYKLQHEWTNHAKVTKSDKWNNTQISNYLAKKENIDLNNPDDWTLDFYRISNLQKFQNGGSEYVENISRK
jgi:hypothetical protein